MKLFTEEGRKILTYFSNEEQTINKVWATRPKYTERTVAIYIQAIRSKR